MNHYYLFFFILLFLVFFEVSDAKEIMENDRVITQIDSILSHSDNHIQNQTFDPALECLNQALHKSQTINYIAGEAKAYLNMGTVYRLKGNNPEALVFFTKSLEKYKKFSDSLGIAESWNGMGLIYTNSGEFSTALDYFFKARDLFRRKKRPLEESNVLLNIGRLYNVSNELDQALLYTEMSLTLKRKLGNQASIANALNNMGVIHRRKGNPEKALELYQESLAIQRSIHDKTGIANALNNIGIILHMKEESAKAIAYFKEALEIREELGDISGVTMGLYNLGFMYSVIGYHTKALDHFQKSIENAKLIGENNFRLRAYEAISEQYQEMGDYKKALLYYEKFHQLNDSLFNIQSKNDLLEIQTRYETAQKEKELLRTRQVTLAFGGLSIMSLAFFITVFIAYKKNKRANRVLKKQNKEIKRQKKNLNEAKQEIQQNLRLKELFFAAANHELRIPLNIILGFTELLDAKINDKSLSQYLESIKTNGKTLQKLVDDILDLSIIDSRLFKLEPEPVNIMDLGKNIYSVFESKLKKLPVRLIVSQDKQLDVWLMIDDVRLRQILYNLMDNAMKFTGEGEINLEFSIQYPDEKNAHTLKIIMEDTGIGIPEECQKIIFDTNYNTKPLSDAHRMGYGLGLQITKKLVDTMGGTIQLISNVEQGTRFEITLPGLESVEKNSIKGQVIESKEEYKTQTSCKILVVDDSELNRRLLSIMLRDFNFNICEAENGEEAVKMLHDDTPDLILMDLYMPNLDGYQTLKSLKMDNDRSKIPVIAVTASASEEERDNVYAAGFDSYITKPVNKDLLLKEIQRLIEKKIPVSSS